MGFRVWCLSFKSLDISFFGLVWKKIGQMNSHFSIILVTSRLWSQMSWFQFQYQDSGFRSLYSSPDYKTQISKVTFPVLISRLKIWASLFQSQYRDSNFKSLHQSLNIKTQLSKVLIPISNIQTLLLNVQPLSKSCNHVTPAMCKMSSEMLNFL